MIKGTLTLYPALLVAFSIATHPPRTIKSASDTFLSTLDISCKLLKSHLILSKTCKILFRLSGSLTSQEFCGSKAILAPFAPPRLSEPLNVDADDQAI